MSKSASGGFGGDSAMTTARRGRRSGVEDRWTRRDGAPTARAGKGRRWLARIVDSRGQEHTRSFDRKVDAEAWLRESDVAVATGAFVPRVAAERLFREVAEAWLETKRRSLKPKTVYGYEGLLRTLVLPEFGGMPVGAVTREDVDAWVSRLHRSGVRQADKGLSASRIIQASQVVAGVLKYAGVADVTRGVAMPRKPESGRAYLGHREVDRLADAMGRHRVLTLFLAYTGVRWGEATALRVPDIDLGRRRVKVARSVVKVGSEYVEGPPKTHRMRTVPVPAFLVDDLRDAVHGRGPEDLVFPGPDGGWLSLYSVRRSWETARSAARVPARLTIHDLRHTAASLAVASGASVLVVARMLGHQDPSVTLRIYADLFDADLDAVADSLTSARAASLAVSETVVPLRRNGSA